MVGRGIYATSLACGGSHLVCLCARCPNRSSTVSVDSGLISARSRPSRVHVPGRSDTRNPLNTVDRPALGRCRNSGKRSVCGVPGSWPFTLRFEYRSRGSVLACDLAKLLAVMSRIEEHIQVVEFHDVN
jgi:hypothetical protein